MGIFSGALKKRHKKIAFSEYKPIIPQYKPIISDLTLDIQHSPT
jgi:hypothetical protein